MSARPAGADPAWLATRAAADTRARAATEATLLPQLRRFLAAAGRSGHPLDVLDLGAGTGNNQRWLRPRLPGPQRWLHTDTDPAALAAAPPGSVPRLLDVTDLGPVLDAAGPRRLVTTAALLDVLTGTALAGLAATLARAGVPALVSLTVTGTLDLVPGHADDAALLVAFNAHQRRGGRLGPDAAGWLAERLARDGFTVTAVDTPWRLGPADPPGFVDRFLTERVAAAVAAQPGLAGPGREWLGARRLALGAGELSAEVGHVDLLCLPPGT